jgi:hypothetical protein
VANVFVTLAFAERLPPHLRRYLRPYDVAFDPQHQGPRLFEFQRRCHDDLRMPAFAEPRGYRGMFQHLRAHAPTPPDLRMIIGPRAGLVVFFRRRPRTTASTSMKAGGTPARHSRLRIYNFR